MDGMLVALAAAIALSSACTKKEDAPAAPAPRAVEGGSGAAPAAVATPPAGSAPAPAPAAPAAAGPAAAPAPPAAAPAPSGATVVMPKTIGRLGDVLGIAVAQKGATKAPECCLDCEPMIPALQQLAKLGTSLVAGPVDAAALRAASAQVRAATWDDLLSSAYGDKDRRGFIAAVAGLGTQLDATATALDDGSNARARAQQVNTAVTKLLAAARELGATSENYCTND